MTSLFLHDLLKSLRGLPDINILFQIVSDAQQSPNPPFRALFAAYDKVLASHGIAPEHDQLFFRYLLRLGEGSGHNTRTLISKLRRLLAKLDIQILVEDEDDAAAEDDEALAEKHVRPPKELGIGSARSNRRASFNDTQLDETWLEQQRHALVDARGRVPTKQKSAHRKSRSLSNQSSVKAWGRHDSAFEPQETMLDSSESNIPSSPPLPPSQHHHPYHPDPPPVDMDSDADAFYYTSQLKHARRCLRQLHQESIRIENMSGIAQNHDQRLLKAQAFNIWAARCLEKRQTAETERFFEHYERRATRARDLFLLNKAFTHWAQSASDEIARTSVAQRHILRTRYFNAWRDITAVNDLKCRRLGLRKWFSVWRTSAARTAVNHERAVAIYEENLVQKTYQTWFFNLCERKAPVWHDCKVKSTCLRRLTDAVAKNRQDDAAAQHLRDGCLLNRTFRVLVERQNTLRALDQTAELQHRTKLLGTCLHQVHQETKLGHASRQLSTTVSRHLLATAVSIWQHNTDLSKQGTALDRHRLLQNAWTQWNNNLRTRALTERIGDRLLLECLYKWALQTRLSLFRRVMDSRLQERVLQTLSSRLAQQRFRLDEASLIFKENKRRRTLAGVMLKFHGRTRTEEMMERQALEFRNARALEAIIPTWTQKTRHLIKLNRWSNDARFYCLATSAIRKWKDATAEAKRNKRRDAYVQIRRRVKLRLARYCLSAWSQKTAHVRQMQGYADERVHARSENTSTSMFAIWRDRARDLVNLSFQADEFRARVLFLRAISILTLKGQEVVNHHIQALALRSQTVDSIATETLKKLKWALFCHRRSQDSAIALERRNAQQHRRSMLRYWAEQATRRRALKTLPLPQDEEEVPESPTKPPPSASVPPVSNLFSSMRLPSARKTPAPPTPFGTTPLLDIDEDTSDAEDMDFSATQRAEEWTSFDVMRDALRNTKPAQPQPQDRLHAIATPIPGYMAHRTPSKRSARAKARSDVLSAAQSRVSGAITPASSRPPPQDLSSTTPQVTPFQRKMRDGGYGGTSTPATFRRTRFGGSVPGGGGVAAGMTGRSVRFFDVGDGQSGEAGGSGAE